MTAWSRAGRRPVDQRHLTLPPTWCPREAAGEVQVESGGVMRSDPSRHTARTLCEAIDGAREMVVVATFLLADGDVEQALLRAAKRGVRVYVLLAAETRLGREARPDAEFELEALEYQKRLLRELEGWTLIRSAESFHSKALLVDPRGARVGFLLTSNLTEAALRRNEELAVRLTAGEVGAAFERLRWAMWEAAEHEVLGPQLSAAPRPLGHVARPPAGGNVVSTLGAPGDLRESVLSLVRSAERELVVASFGWDERHDVVRELCARAKAGLPVTVLARVRGASMPALLALAHSGARVLGFRWLHAKAVLCDGTRGLVMSANFEPHGLEKGFELGVIVDGDRSCGLGHILGGWASSAPFVLEPKPRLGMVLGEAQVWVENRLVEFKVSASGSVECGNHTASSADALDEEPPLAKHKFGLPHPAHSLERAWITHAPRLERKSKELAPKPGAARRDGDPPVFQEASGRKVVAVRHEAELGRAREVARAAGAAAIVVREPT